jgi:tetratricopeptide (TPR) repeat protein
MSESEITIEPMLSPAERDEIGHLDYLLARLGELRNRGLIAPDSYATVLAETESRRQALERSGRIAAALSKARALANREPGKALAWAERARELDPLQVEAWKLVVALNWELGEDEEAIRLCSEAARRFSQFQDELDRLRGQLARRAKTRLQRSEALEQEQNVSAWLAAARRALEEKRDAEAVALCRQVLALRPRHTDALATSAFALQRMGELDLALEQYRLLSELQPQNTTWLHWVRAVQIRRGISRVTGKAPEAAQAIESGHRPTAEVSGSESTGPPDFSWSSFAGEFLQEHWQKLILCLAVLLIVVSSTVGAHLVLGEKLWSPVGKCALALLATLLFASLGAGLLRWGADRAGRMMLIATLIVVPIHFMLAGELRLLLEPPSPRHIFLAIDALALVAMVRWVSGMLARPSGARFLTIALLLISIGSAATTRGSPVAWSLQFTSFQLSPLVFLASVWALGARRWGRSSDEHREFVYMMLGLLGFALLSCLFRTGAYALRLEPSLYALPLMLGAISLVHASRRLEPYEPNGRRLALMRLGGYALSGLAFAVALARPPVPSALASGNIVAVALLGMALYVASLRAQRLPVFLYLALASLAIGRLGAHYFIADRLHAIEEAVRLALGYPQFLPKPFRALLGLPLTLALGWLSTWFVKHWNDRNLARHCHVVGLPLSIAACVWSGFEPLAAVYCLSGFALLYLLAVWVFAAPWVTYLAVAALCGASYFGSTLVPGVTLAGQALLAAVIASGCRGVRLALGRFQAPERFCAPWIHSALALTVVATTTATVHLVVSGIATVAGAGAFALIMILAVLMNREWPRAIWAHLALLCFLEFTMCALGVATEGRSLPAHDFGLLFAFDALAVLALAGALHRIVRNAAGPHEAAHDLRWAMTFLTAIPGFAVVLTAVADCLGFVDIERSWLTGMVFLLGAATLLGTTRLVRRQSLVYLGLAQLVMGLVDLSAWSIDRSHPAFLIGWLSLTVAFIAAVLWSVAAATRRHGLSPFYTEPCFHTTFVLTVGAFVAAIGARFLGREAYQLGVAALLLNTLVTMLLSWTWRRPELTHGALFHFVAASYVVLFSVGNNDPEMAYVLGLAAVSIALVLWLIGLVCERARDDWTRGCARPQYHWALLLTVLAVLLCDRSSVTLALVGVSFLLAVKGVPRTYWLYGSVAALAAACGFRWLTHASQLELIALATLAAFVLWGLGVLIQRNKPSLCRRLGLLPLAYEFPLFHSSIAAGSIALLLRIALSSGQNVAWTAHGWLPLGLAVLSLFMLRAYPRRACVHASLAFLTWCVAAAIVPSLTSPCYLALAGIGLAVVLLVIERVVRPIEPALCAQLGVIDVGYAQVVQGWATVIFGLTASLAFFVVVAEMAAALFGLRVDTLGLSLADWWAMLAVIFLIGAFLMIAGTDPEGWGAMEAEHELIALHAVSVFVLWWLGVACSPLAGRGVSVAVYYPLSTAIAALATAQVIRRFTHAESWHELPWLGSLRSEQLGRMLSIQASLLAVLATLFTKGAVEPTTVLSLILAALTLGLVALASGWEAAALAGSLAWSAAWGVAGLVVAPRLGWAEGGLRASCAAAFVLTSAFSLWFVSGGLWRDRSSAKRPISWVPGLDESVFLRLARAVEIASFAASLFAAGMVLIAGAQPATLGVWGTTLGVFVLMGAALLQILLVPRWQAEWLVYLAQAMMVGSYVQYRLAFPQPITTDAVVLTLLGYLDLVAAEVLERLRLARYARPTRYFSLLLPVLPLIQLFWSRGLDDVSLFHLMAAATFYGIACGQLRWKSLGYAAAVLYNAALWVLWSRIGWKLSDHPQYYLVPVGLSTILFAEVNRRELDRPTLNTIRSVGLLIVYVSLAVPLWQFENFGAWLALLFGSLAAVFIGIGLRLQVFLWMGLATFVSDVVYQMGHVSLEYAFAKWAIMLTIGIALVLFVALNEKKRIVDTMRLYYGQARLWE